MQVRKQPYPLPSPSAISIIPALLSEQEEGEEKKKAINRGGDPSTLLNASFEINLFETEKRGKRRGGEKKNTGRKRRKERIETIAHLYHQNVLSFKMRKEVI